MDIKKAIREGMEPVNHATLRISGIKELPEGTTVTKITTSNAEQKTETVFSYSIQEATQTEARSIRISG